MFEVDLPGRVSNMRLSSRHALQPLFEAISNSIHSVEDAGGAGQIDVYIERERDQQVLEIGDLSSLPITGFRVCDTGVGFTETNWQAFNRCDTTAKASRGGKGIGRLLWLKAFDEVRIHSVYSDGKKSQLRTFRFRLPDGTQDLKVKPAAENDAGTIVELRFFKKEFRDSSPKSLKAISKRIIDHFFEYFVLEACPLIVLHEVEDIKIVDVNSVFRDDVLSKSQSATFKVRDQEFSVLHVLASTGHETEHRLNFCAHRRAVSSELLKSRLQDLPSTLRSDDGKKACVYAGYVSGPYLDAAVKPERTGFDLMVGDGLAIPGEVPWEELAQASFAEAASFLEPHTKPVRESKEQQIKDYVMNRAPHFRVLIKNRPTIIDQIPPNLSPEKLEIELYKHNQQYQQELRSRSQLIISAISQTELGKLDEMNVQVDQFLEEWNEAGMAELARYVATRKAILSFLEVSLGVQSSGKYSREDAIHRVIFPLKATSDDVPAERMNLWLIDERLAYHYYLASDLEMRKATPLDTDGKQRPDLLIFHGPSVFADSSLPFAALTIIEFKRPLRDDYSDDENPIRQVYDYAEKIRSGQAKDRRGRMITVPDRIPFYAYIVCDLTPTLKRQARDASLRPFPEGDGYFGFQPDVAVYVEVLSFDRILVNAKKRNGILFEKLGLPSAV